MKRNSESRSFSKEQMGLRLNSGGTYRKVPTSSRQGARKVPKSSRQNAQNARLSSSGSRGPLNANKGGGRPRHPPLRPDGVIDSDDDDPSDQETRLNTDDTSRPRYENKNGIRTKRQNNKIRVNGVKNNQVGLNYIRKLVMSPPQGVRHIEVLTSAFSRPSAVTELLRMGFHPHGTGVPPAYEEDTLKEMGPLVVNDYLDGVSRIASSLTYNTEMRNLDPWLKLAITLIGGRVGRQVSIPRFQRLAELALHDRSRSSEALRLISRKPRNVRAMPLANAKRYIMKHLTSGRYRPPPGFKTFLEGEYADYRSLDGKQRFKRRVVNKANNVNQSVYDEAVASLDPANVVVKNGVLDETRLLSLIRKEKRRVGFSSNRSSIPALAAEMAFKGGERIGRGGYGETRKHTLSDGTVVIIKSFFQRTQGQRVREAEAEQSAHLRVWAVRDLRPYITMPLHTQLLPHGHVAMTVQTFAGEVGDSVQTLDAWIPSKGGSVKNFQMECVLDDIRNFIRIMKRHGIRHNDMNPRNILIRSRGNLYLGIVVIDWGLSSMPRTPQRRKRYAFEEYWTDDVPEVLQRNLSNHPRWVLGLRQRMGDPGIHVPFTDFDTPSLSTHHKRQRENNRNPRFKTSRSKTNARARGRPATK